MKKITLFFAFLLCSFFSFSQSIFLDGGPGVPADDPLGQPALSYSIGSATEVTVVITTGAMTADLFLAASNGTPFSKMEIKVYDDQNKVVSRITIHEAFVSSIQSLGLTQTVTFTSDKIKIKDSGH
jgi:hypothetical protein